MTISLTKTVVMCLGTSIPPRIFINGSLLKVVDKLSYLGSVVNSSNSLDDEMNQRIGKASGDSVLGFGTVTISLSN